MTLPAGDAAAWEDERMSVIPDGYSLHSGPPSVSEYRRLRADSGLTPVSQTQAEKAIPGTWAFRHVRHSPTERGTSAEAGTAASETAPVVRETATAASEAGSAAGEAVAMGRIVGDGGWYFVVADMATLPDHQRRGLGRAILTALLEEVRAAAEPGAFVTLTADPPGRRLYESLGFEDVAIADETGMRLWLRD